MINNEFEGESIIQPANTGGETSSSSRVDNTDNRQVREEYRGLSSKEVNQNTKVEISREDKQRALDEYCNAAIQESLVTLNALAIKEKFPLSYTECVKYMEKRSNIKVDEDTVIGVFLYTPRVVLFEFFDTNDLYINVYGNNSLWQYKILNEHANKADSLDTFVKSRAEAETISYLKAFELLETKLKK